MKNNPMEKEIEKKDTFSFCISLVFSIFAIIDGEITLSRQKKETSFFVLLSTFRKFALNIGNQKWAYEFY